MNCSLPGSSAHGILQAGILEWVAFPPPKDLPDPGIEPTCFTSPAFAGRFFTTSPAKELESAKAAVPVLPPRPSALVCLPQLKRFCLENNLSSENFKNTLQFKT